MAAGMQMGRRPDPSAGLAAALVPVLGPVAVIAAAILLALVAGGPVAAADSLDWTLADILAGVALLGLCPRPRADADIFTAADDIHLAEVARDAHLTVVH
ncbi:MAG: hypothetical protein JNM13_02410 [Hyphomicrobiaceae bacterium]|nr:hypothetical protein [Hyphomicrobiaceae bacterium]